MGVFAGVVPVKLSARGGGGKAAGDIINMKPCECPAMHSAAGQLVVPSGWNDGTAVLVPAAEGVSRVGILLDMDDVLGSPPPPPQPPEEGAAAPESGGCQLVTVLVVAPPDTTRGAGARTSQLRRLALGIVWLMAILAVAVVLARHTILFMGQVRNRISFAPFYTKNAASFYQDRLGTNIGKAALKK